MGFTGGGLSEVDPEVPGWTLGAEVVFFWSNLRRIWLNRSSESTTNKERIWPFNSGLMRRKIGVCSELEKLQGNFFTASTKVYT